MCSLSRDQRVTRRRAVRPDVSVPQHVTRWSRHGYANSPCRPQLLPCTRGLSDHQLGVRPERTGLSMSFGGNREIARRQSTGYPVRSGRARPAAHISPPDQRAVTTAWPPVGRSASVHTQELYSFRLRAVPPMRSDQRERAGVGLSAHDGQSRVALRLHPAATRSETEQGRAVPREQQPPQTRQVAVVTRSGLRHLIATCQNGRVPGGCEVSGDTQTERRN